MKGGRKEDGKWMKSGRKEDEKGKKRRWKLWKKRRRKADEIRMELGKGKVGKGLPINPQKYGI